MGLMFRTASAAAALLMAAVAMGCAGGATKGAAAPAATDNAAADAAAALVAHHRYHHHGGVALFLAMSLDTLGVASEQRGAVEKVRSELHARMEPARNAERTLTSVLADGVAAGAIDSVKVEEAIGSLSLAAQSGREATAFALTELHTRLTPAQRTALADKVEAHWAVWREANAIEQGPASAGAGHLGSVALALELTPAQIEAVRASLSRAPSGAMRFDAESIARRFRAFGEEFRKETLSSTASVAASETNDELAVWGARQMVRFVLAVSPVLTPEQRATFAELLREHAIHNPAAEARQ